MNTITTRLISSGLCLILIFLSGFWLSRSGKPYPVVLFTIHKLIAIGAVILLGLLVNQLRQTAALQTLQIVAVAITAVFFLATIITGGLVSVDSVMPAFVLRIHQIIPFLTVISVGVTLYLLLLGGAQVTGAAS